ncbi:hypothetical protein JCM10450v2_002064 [Rhodotorula kratochvilovae]
MNVPGLKVLTLSTSMHLEYFDFSGDIEWLDNLSRFRSSGEGLRTIRFFDPIYLPSIQEVSYLREWARKHDIEVELDPLTVFPNLVLVDAVAARQQFVTTGTAGHVLVSSVNQTVDFIENWRRRAASTGDVVEFARLAEVLRAAELERAAAAT